MIIHKDSKIVGGTIYIAEGDHKQYHGCNFFGVDVKVSDEGFNKHQKFFVNCRFDDKCTLPKNIFYEHSMNCIVDGGDCLV